MQCPVCIAWGSCSVAASPTEIIVTGGACGGDNVQMQKLDVTTNTWTKLEDMPRKRFWHGCSLFEKEGKKYIVVAGAENANQESSDIYDVSADSWITGGNMNKYRRYPEIVTVNNRVVVIGGRIPSGDPDNTLEELNLDDWSWSMLDVTMSEGRGYFSAVVVPRDMIARR